MGWFRVWLWWIFSGISDSGGVFVCLQGFCIVIVRNLIEGPSRYLRLGMTAYPSPGFLGVFGCFAYCVAVEY